MEQSIILVKPDTIKRKLLPKLKQMLYKENLEIINTLEVKLTENIIYDFQPFLKNGKKIKETDRQKIIKSLCQDPVLLFAIEENKALNKVKNIKTKFRKNIPANLSTKFSLPQNKKYSSVCISLSFPHDNVLVVSFRNVISINLLCHNA